MGRTLHYSINRASGKFTRKELEAIYNVSLKYNTGNYADAWSCENFFCNPYEHYPNWKGKYMDMNAEDAWKAVSKDIEFFIHEGNHYFDAVLKLHKNRDVVLHNGPPKNKLSGFIKVQGNELNALMALMALVDISIQVPDAEIRLSDEGEFLLCDLIIRNGKAMPKIDSLLEAIKRYCHLMLFSESYKGNILNSLKYRPADFSHEFQMACNLGNNYGDMTKYISEKLRNLKEIEGALIRQGATGNKLHIFNLENRICKDWFCPYEFTRKVDVKKFIDYKCTPATLMDGFSGEGFGLSTDDAESKSFYSISQIQKLFNSPDVELKVLGE